MYRLPGCGVKMLPMADMGPKGLMGLASLWVILLGGCQSVRCSLSPAGMIQKHGTPDLISEQAGDLKRSFLPGHRPEYKWPHAIVTLFYLNDGRKFRLENGQWNESSMSPDERREVEDSVRRLRSQPNVCR
jgi:hypothetical protein